MGTLSIEASVLENVQSGFQGDRVITSPCRSGELADYDTGKLKKNKAGTLTSVRVTSGFQVDWCRSDAAATLREYYLEDQ